MVKRMLIDATHSEETRVVVVNGTRLESFDVETSTKKQIKGNIYLAKVIRVEPSLQAAFVDYGGNRHGFLAFSEIHPDYYQIPVADRQALIEEQKAEAAREAAEDDDGDNGDDVEDLGGDEAEEERAPRARSRPARNYKIQEVIKRKQIMLVQVVKEERGNKGAALTTYISLAGRYCVLMPNTARGGGVSRKIVNATDRRRLKTIMSDLDVPGGMAVILRTAGAERSKAEIRRDYDYLIRTWNQIRETTMESRAPALIHEEANLIKRSIRDVYSADLEEVLVEGEEGYRLAKDFMKMLTPSHAKKVQRYRDPIMPLFHRYQVDSQLDAMHSPVVQLRSGGYVVINQTEALVAIDVNSGRATKERHIEETAVKTNLEAADEIARQLRLRDLAGLIVIDFIDMEENRNNAAVEKRLKEALKTDRARIQVGRISAFGLLELSRQRLRPSLMETSFHSCPHCGGTGMIRSTESTAVHILRIIEEEGVRQRSSEVTVTVHPTVALYILNYKREALGDIQSRYGIHVFIQGDESLIPPDHRMERVKGDRREEVRIAAEVTAEPEEDEDEEAAAAAAPAEAAKPARAEAEAEEDEDEKGNGKKRRRRRRRKKRNGDAVEAQEGQGESAGDAAGATEAADRDDEAREEREERHAEAAEASEESREAGSDEDEDEGEDGKRRRRRSRRGGRRRRKSATGEDQDQDQDQDQDREEHAAGEQPGAVAAEIAEDHPHPSEVEVEVAVSDEDEGGHLTPDVDEEPAPAAGRKPRRRRTRKPETAEATEGAEEDSARAEARAVMAEAAEADADSDSAGRTVHVHVTSEPAKPRTGWWDAMPQPAETAVTVTAEPEPRPEPEAEAPSEPVAETTAPAPEPAEEEAAEEEAPAPAAAISPEADDLPVKPRRGWWEIGG
ncbi:ribonuclease E/G [Caenispirillum salinarum]|uniref:Rne/Rng family ribonuclease n=1 Tax=Caenispirillum salinarum TaxID=859058 RepID=UPI00384D0FDD